MLNEDHQQVGPTNAVIAELGSFLSTLVRNSTFCPINIFNWSDVTDKMKDDMWIYTKVYSSQYFKFS